MVKEDWMGKSNRSGFFLFLILITMIWTIYSHFFQEKEVVEQMPFQNDKEFIDFLAQNLGIEDAIEFEEDEISFEHHHHHEIVETSYQPMHNEAKDFQLETLQRKKVKLSDFRGKKLLINFWTSWCPPCKEEMPQMNDYYEQYAEKQNVEILAINITDQEFLKRDVENFVKEHKIKFPILLDEAGTVSMDYEVLTIPTSFIIDEEGNIVEKVIGPVTKDILVEKFQEE